MSDSACVVTYLAVVIGAGTFQLPAAVARVGWLKGLLLIVTMSTWNYGMSHLICSLPSMFECNFETYASIGQFCLPPRLGTVFIVLSMLVWCGAASFQLTALARHLQAVVSCLRESHVSQTSPMVRSLCILPVVAFLWKTRGSQLVKVSRLSLRAMFMVAALEVLMGTCHYTYRRFVEGAVVEVVAWRTPQTPEEVEKFGNMAGISQMILAYGGLGLLPYCLADLLHPQNALKVVRKASLQIGVMYTFVGVVCYLCWGDDLLERSPSAILISLGAPYTWVVALISLLFSFKAMCCYPLLFWPLMREIELAVGWHRLPCAELRLPWATKWQKRMKMAARVALSSLTLLPLQLEEGGFGRHLCTGCFVIAFVLAQILGAVFFIVQSLFVHKRNLRRLPALQSQADEDSRTSHVSRTTTASAWSRATTASAGHRATAASAASGATFASVGSRATTASAATGRATAVSADGRPSRAAHAQSRTAAAASVYLGGSRFIHFVAAGIIAAIGTYVGVLLIYQTLAKLASELLVANTSAVPAVLAAGFHPIADPNLALGGEAAAETVAVGETFAANAAAVPRLVS